MSWINKFLIGMIIIILSFSSAGQTNTKDGLEKYLDRFVNKTADIVFVFDTSGSMGKEIYELRAISKDFANQLSDSGIDYRLGLVAFRDFPISCEDQGKRTTCGFRDDFPYKIYGEGNLTDDLKTFDAWLGNLEAKGGSDEPEAVLPAIRHAQEDLTWREGSDKIIILISDAYPHPDGGCCNAEGDTLNGTISGLVAKNVKVYVVGPDKESMRKISDSTSGRFYKIRSGMTLQPILNDIIGFIEYGFQISLNTSCQGQFLGIKASLIGRGATIPFIPDQTEVWMSIMQENNSSRIDLKYDKKAGAYICDIDNLDGAANLTVYGRVGKWGASRILEDNCSSFKAEEAKVESVAPRVNATSSTKPRSLISSGTVQSVAFSPDSSKLATGGGDHAACIWDVANGAELQRLPHEGLVYTVSFSPDGSKLATASWDNTSCIWDVKSGTKLLELDHDDRVWSVSFSPDGSKLATGSWDKTARIWDVASGAELQKLDHENHVWSVSFSPDRNKLATGSDDDTARIWDVASGTELQKLTHDGQVYSVSFSPDGSKLATGSAENKSAHIWDVASGAELHHLTGWGAVYSVSFSPDGSKLATGSGDNTARIWDVESGMELHTLSHNHLVWSVSFSTDGSKLATASFDNTTRIWDVASGKELQRFHHDFYVNSVSFSPDGNKLASGSNDRTARIWDVASGVELQKLSHNGTV